MTTPRPKPNWRLTLARLAALVFVVGLTAYIYSLGQRVAELEKYSYPGIFLFTLLAYATVIVPAPGLAIVFAAGGKFSPLGVGLAAGAGAALGELSGYLAGFSGQGIIENQAIYERFRGWMARYGPVVITLVAIVPSPFFDLVGIIAGASKMPVPRFLFWCLIGQVIKCLIVAYAGHFSVDWLRQFLS